jgi:hypothetical protein
MYVTNNEAIVATNSANTGDALSASGVSWAAIFAGAVAATALSLILLILGTGLGMSAVSPWAQEGISATTFGASTIAWVTFMALAASGIGGYLAGRLRTKWVGVHTDEVYFRDTAHGFLAWGVATLFTAALLTSVTASIVTGGVKAGASLVGGAVSTAGKATSAAAGSIDSNSAERALDYFVDTLFRSNNAGTNTVQAQSQSVPPETTLVDQAAPSAESFPVNEHATQAANQNVTSSTQNARTSADAESAAASTAEVTRIFLNSIWRDEGLPQGDVRYVAQLISERTDLTQQEAEQRVNETYARLQTQMSEAEDAAKEAADKARSASAYASLWFFVSLLLGAFTASIAATIGGKQRDL